MNRSVKRAKPKVKRGKAKVKANRPVPGGKRAKGTAHPSAEGRSSTVRSLQKRLAEALEQQAATSEILRVISRSPTDLQPVFDAIVHRASELCDGHRTNLVLLEDGTLRLAAQFNAKPRSITSPTFPRPLARDVAAGRAILDRAPLQIRDAKKDREYAPGFARALDLGSILSVPLLREGKPIGAISVSRANPGAFPASRMELLKTFADQAVIAIENVRLFNETKDALDQQTATAEILQAISSSPGNLQPVLETLVHAAAKFCGAPDVIIQRADQGVLHVAAAVGSFADILTREAGSIGAVEIPTVRGSVSGRAFVDRRMIHIHDLAAESEVEYPEGRALQRRFGHRTMVATPLLREGVAIGVIAMFRMEVKAFSDKQLQLLRIFADQAVIAIENVRLFHELEVKNRDLTEALEQQTATSDILRVISQSPTDVQPVFDTIAQAAHKLCRARAANVFTYDGELLHLATFVSASPEYVEALKRHYPRPLSRDTAIERAVQSRSVVVIPDVHEDNEYAPAIGLHADAGGFRSVLAVPLMRDGYAIGGIAVGRAESGPFPDSQIALLRTFADQAVIAIENVRLFTEREARNRDLTEALEQQTATSEILRVISQSPTDVQPVFDTIAAAALKLCGATFATVVRFDGRLVDFVAFASGWKPEEVSAIRQFYPRPPSRDTVASRAILAGTVVNIPDVQEDSEYAIRDVARSAGYRSAVGVPLMHQGKPIGAFGVGRPQVGLFPEKQVALLKTFADQAVIAIENVRLFRELEARNRDLSEALEQQTATSDILRVISQSPTDVQPVFETIVASALKLCRAHSATVLNFDGKLLQLAALAIANPEGADAVRQLYPRPAGRDSAAGRAVLSGNSVTLPDVLEDPEFTVQMTARARASAGFRSVVSMPLIRDGDPIGAINVGRREPGPFPDTQIALLKTFADQAVIAIENVRLFKELEARTTDLTRSVGELKALGEVGQAVSSTLDLETVLTTIVARATHLAGVAGGSIYEYDAEREEFHLRATDGLPGELIEVLGAAPIPKGEGALGRLAITSEPVQIRNIADDATYQSRVREMLIRLGSRSLLAVPLLREDHLLGGLVVNRKSAGDFAPEVIELLKTFATQSALAIQNARLFREIEVKSRELETASRHKSEFLANMSHELRTPLNAIIGFSEVLSQRMFGEINDKQAEYLSDILESGRHLLSLINDILDLSKIEAGRMELEPTDFNLQNAIDNTLTLVRERAQRRSIALGRTVDERLGAIHGDERKVKQVLLNLLSNALKFTPEGGKIDVRAEVRDGVAEISVRDTGVGIAPEDQEAVFEEFKQVGTASKKVEGTGLGLAISRKFVELHGGRIWVTSQVGSGSTFTFTLPLSIG